MAYNRIRRTAGKANNVILKNKTSANYSITRGRSADLYPVSQFGVIALLRQVNYDAQWYKQLPTGYFHDDGLEAYTANLCLLYTSPSPRDRTRSRMPSSA